MTEIYSELNKKQREDFEELIESVGLRADEPTERTALIYEGDTLIATASRLGGVLKLFAISPAHQGEDLTASLISALRRDALEAGHNHLFVYTKPKNEHIFRSLFFYTVVRTADVLLMEDKPHGIRDYLDTLPRAEGGVSGAIVMNANPFTKGHRHLAERAARECDRVYLFVLSEDKSEFSAHDRLEMVRLGVADLSNVTVLETGPYLISRATFPTYFLEKREKADEARCEVDIAIFLNYIVPRLGISRRYVGEEPLSPLTEMYNRALARTLADSTVELVTVPRLKTSGEPISASRVRELIHSGERDALSALLPDTTLRYLGEHNLI